MVGIQIAGAVWEPVHTTRRFEARFTINESVIVATLLHVQGTPCGDHWAIAIEENGVFIRDIPVMPWATVYAAAECAVECVDARREAGAFRLRASLLAGRWELVNHATGVTTTTIKPAVRDSFDVVKWDTGHPYWPHRIISVTTLSGVLDPTTDESLWKMTTPHGWCKRVGGTVACITDEGCGLFSWAVHARPQEAPLELPEVAMKSPAPQPWLYAARDAAAALEAVLNRDTGANVGTLPRPVEQVIAEAVPDGE